MLHRTSRTPHIKRHSSHMISVRKFLIITIYIEYFVAIQTF